MRYLQQQSAPDALVRWALLLQGLQRQISFEEQRGRERLAELAERSRRSISETQQQRVQQIAGEGLTRLQQQRDEAVGKITAVHQAANQVSPFS